MCKEQIIKHGDKQKVKLKKKLWEFGDKLNNSFEIDETAFCSDIGALRKRKIKSIKCLMDRSNQLKTKSTENVDI